MTCPDCLEATQRPWPLYRGLNCAGCRARAVLVLAQYRRAAQDGDWHDRQYRALLAHVGVSHEQVRAAAAADFEQGRAG